MSLDGNAPAMISTTQYVAFDTETTGLSPVDDRIVELAAVSFGLDGVIAGRFEELIDPQFPIPPALTAIHGIDDSMVSGKPTLADILPAFLEFIEGSVMVAHNAVYDISMLLLPVIRTAGPGGLPDNMVLDTCSAARVIFPGAPSYRLQEIARRVGVTHDVAHRAGADVAACRGLFLKLLAAGGPSATPWTLPAFAGSALRFGLQEEILDELTSLGRNKRLACLRAPLHQSKPVTLVYRGGTKGASPRLVTPIAFQRVDGFACLLANCHIDRTLKCFRLDRVEKVAPA